MRRRFRGGRGALGQPDATATTRMRWREQIQTWLEEAPVLAFDRAAADAGRHPRPGAQPRRAGLADRRAAVRGGRARGGRRPASSARAARGAGPARRDQVRGPAPRRSQPRLPAGLAVDRLEPGAAARPRLWPRGRLWRDLRAGRGNPRNSPKHMPRSAELLRIADFTTPSASWKRSCRARSTAGASSIAGSAWRRATRSTS